MSVHRWRTLTIALRAGLAASAGPVVAALCAASVGTHTAAAQTGMNVVGRPVAQVADTMFREGTRALTKGNYRRAASLFELLRLQFPRSAYVPDSYYWQAFALQRLDNANALRQARIILDEQQLRFPEAAAGDDVLALRARVESVAPPTVTAAVACAEREEQAAVDALTALTALSDAAEVQGYLASLLAMRSPCARELRRSAVYLLGTRGEPEARRMLEAVTRHDPDGQVRADAQRLLADSSAVRVAGSRLVPPPRSARDSISVAFGDTAAAGALALSERRDGKLSVRVARPAQLIVLAITPGQSPVLLAPASLGDARRTAAGVVSVDLGALDSRVLVAENGATEAQRDFDFRRSAEIEACVARQTAQAQAAIDREWNARADKSGKPVLPVVVGGPVDIARTGGLNLLAASAACTQRASRSAPPPSTTVMRGVLTPAPADRYVVAFATPQPLSMPWLLVRVGTMRPTGATAAAMLESVAATLFAGHPAPWSGLLLPR